MTSPTNSGEEPAPHLHFDDFLAPGAVDRLLDFVASRESELKPSGVLIANEGEKPEDIRRSKTLFDIEPIWPLFESSLTTLLPLMRKELSLNHFTLDHIERQLAVHFDGDFFGPHNDSGSREVASRRVTYVYYFNRQPTCFDGGRLRLYHRLEDNGVVRQGTAFTEVEPRHNSIVFFPSEIHHEVLPVHTHVDGLDGARMTVTGWFHQGVPGPLSLQNEA